jgi:hypothetical protein
MKYLFGDVRKFFCNYVEPITGYVCRLDPEEHDRSRMSEHHAFTSDTSAVSEYRVEAYVDVPEHDVHGSYGQVLRHIERGDWCARWVITVPKGADDLAIYTQALKQTMEDQEVKAITAGADHYTVRIHHKNSGPEWKIEVDNAW